MQKHILVIDDEPEVANLLKTRLEANQYSVDTASDGAEGLEKMDNTFPDLILLDIMMPGMDGYTFIRELKGRQMAQKTPPVMVLTAKGQMQDLFELEGVSDYMTKPYRPEILLEKVKKLIEAKK